tara:strand:+ start:1093 stop:1404 length:312 start_codon:yes stop_codon:yes gene_type:complete
MNLIRSFAFLFIALGSLSACSNSGSSTPGQSKTDKAILSKLDRIERAFDKGDTSTACDLHIKLSQDLEGYEAISPELLRSIKEFQFKCGKRSFSIDFGKEKDN